ncbi:MAG: tRNA (guanosine(46)-N7)-methyltransferase TrmB [Hyphomicrobiaceae bacterium]|nr:tRNA (guanosine(46)-N7)-methyltransferase TrmB [Hyphomicrobiaceae bacterium]
MADEKTSADHESDRELAADGAGDLRSFGRRRGRKATERQRMLLETLLPEVAVGAPTFSNDAQGAIDRLFGEPVRETWLEIGFGGGEHLVWQARANSDVGLIGAEPFEDGVVKVLSEIDADRQTGDRKLANVRLLADDVRPLLRALPQASLDRVFILFPDPWPKRRHAKRRLVQPPLVELLARVMKPGAELRVGTDIGDYARTALLALTSSPDFVWQAAGPQDWRVRPSDWPGTRYEAKAIREGRCCYFLRFTRAK